MPEDVRICPLCKSERNVVLDQREFRGKRVVNRLCRSCGLVYQSPRMTQSESASFYADEYRLLYEGSIDPTSRNLHDQRGRADSLLRFCRHEIGTISRHLDIGCSFGILLQQFQAVYCSQAIGIEPGDAHRVQAREAGLQVYASLEELQSQGSKRFDLVSMSHVLEHLPDPAGYLTQLRETFLNNRGWLLLEVPNLYAHDCFEIAHLVSYSTHMLTQVVEQAGYTIVKIKTHGRPRSHLLPLYITVLAKPLSIANPSRILRPEKAVALKRQAGMLRRRLLERFFPKQAWITSSETE